MKFNKLFLFIGVIVGVSSISASAGSLLNKYSQPHSLTIINDTDSDSTAIVNGGACSTILVDKVTKKVVGITRAHDKPNEVPAYLVKIACFQEKEKCTADIYMTNNCYGPDPKKPIPPIARVRLNIYTGIYEVENIPSSGYSVIAVNPYTAKIIPCNSIYCA